MNSLLLLLVPFVLLVSASLSLIPAISTAHWRARSVRICQFLVLAPVAFAGFLLVSAATNIDGGWFLISPFRLVILTLVLGLGAILLGFSRHYMAGESCFDRFNGWLLLTLFSVSITVIANHLLAFWLGWLAISLSLHQLLMLYPERPRAVLAAHKKFILARVAETSLLLAFVLLYVQHGSFWIDELMTQFSLPGAAQTLAWQDQLAAVLIAFAALIKCAQLPVHGWLIKVVEVPTPVSALLHAGVINLGGFVLILFAPLFSLVSIAQWLVLLVAGFTTILAALIMTTRISYKVRLAWSTSAQMGLMLLECALGLYEVALLHLVAHSLYKAFAFLNSGNAVHEDIGQRLAPISPSGASGWFAAGIIAIGVIAPIAWIVDTQGVLSPWLLFALAMTLLVAERRHALTISSLLTSVSLVAVLTLGYSLMKTLFSHVLSLPASVGLAAGTWADIWACFIFLSLFGTSVVMLYGARFAPVRRLSNVLFAGLYLDEWFTRVTLQLWPTEFPQRAKNTRCSASITVFSKQETPS